MKLLEDDDLQEKEVEEIHFNYFMIFISIHHSS